MTTFMTTLLENMMPYLLLMQAGIYAYEAYIEFKKDKDPEEKAKEEWQKDYARIRDVWKNRAI